MPADTALTSALRQLAEDAVSLLGAGAVALRRHRLADGASPDGNSGTGNPAGASAEPVVETLAVAGPNAAALRAGDGEQTDEAGSGVRVLGRWRRREHGVAGELESHPVLGPTGARLGWLVFERGPATPNGRQAEILLRLVLGQAGALLASAALSAELGERTELLARRSDELRVTDRALRLAFEESVVGMAMISLDPADAGRYLQVNDALCRLTGYSREELLARPFEEVTHPEDRGLTASAIRRAMAGRRTPFRTDKRFLRPDGSICWVRVTATPLFDDDDRPLYALGQVEDLSARGDHDAELAVQLDPLTGLLNAGALDQALDETVQRAHRNGTGCAVLVAELDGWEELNAEPGGADLADELQLALAQRLRSTLRGGDVISRVGANQFVIIAEEVGPQDADSVARRLAAALVEPEVVGGRELSIAAKMGVSVLTDELEGDEDQSATLLEQARTALSRARGSVGGSHVLYSDYSGGSATKNSSAQALYVHPDWQGRH